jgi:hypothetical protein
MNQRIDQLWAQALDAAVPETYTRLSHSQVLKIKQVFADMIVQECIDIIAPYSVRMSRPGEEYLHPIQEIKEHFGVEELKYILTNDLLWLNRM